MEITPIAYIRSDFQEKFGIPRQSGLVEALRAEVVFAPEYRVPEAVRGLEDFSHIWLGGNRRLGVFATRAPFRPNALGLSAVRLEAVEPDAPRGPVLHVSGADLLDGTPIYDIKPYIPYADAIPGASGGFTDRVDRLLLAVDCPPDLLERVPTEKREALLAVLAQDPRPSYQEDPDRVYGMAFAGLQVRFTVGGNMLTVREIEK